jgi:hypothetical protein
MVMLVRMCCTKCETGLRDRIEDPCKLEIGLNVDPVRDNQGSKQLGFTPLS